MENFEAIKSVTLKALVLAGLLSEAAAEEFGSTHGIVVYKESWYKRIFKRDDKDTLRLQCIKLALTENSPEEE